MATQIESAPKNRLPMSVGSGQKVFELITIDDSDEDETDRPTALSSVKAIRKKSIEIIELDDDLPLPQEPLLLNQKKTNPQLVSNEPKMSTTSNNSTGMMHLSSVLSSVININHSPISSQSSQLPLKPHLNTATVNKSNIADNAALTFYKMPSPTSKMDATSSSYHHHTHTNAGYYRRDNTSSGNSNVDMLKQQWTTSQSSKSNSSISSSISYRTKSLSSSASTSSGCSSDSEQGLNLHDDEHHHHDKAPDSPDSGVSGSISGGDDIKSSTDFEDDHVDGSHTDNYKRSYDIMDLDEIYANFNNPSHCDNQHKVRKNCEVDSTYPTAQLLDPLSITINQLTANAKNNVPKNYVKPQYSCRWYNCDWPGSYEELADHLREIHVELQPYLDSNGKVIKQWSKRKSQTKLRKDLNMEEDVSSNSESEDEDTQEDEDDELGSDDDSKSIDSASTCRVTRRSNQNQGLLDYSHYNNSAGDLRLRRSYRSSNGDQVANVDKAKLSQQQFVCLWRGCKVYGKPSSSRLWLERHILEQHSGPKPFKCIVDTCGLRFKSQASLNRHVNTHFRADQPHQNHHLPTSGTVSTSGTNQSNGSSGNCCCSCCCHSCMICDNSSCHPEPAPLSDKNRSDSTDSGISLNSSPFEECLPSSSSLSSSTTSTSSSSTSHESLSKLANPTSDILPSHQNGFCHARFCCSMQTEKQIVANANRLSNLISKTKHWNRKNLISTNRPIVRSISNLDFLDDQFSQKLSHKVTTRDRFIANLSPLEATIKKLTIKSNNKHQQLPLLPESSDEDDAVHIEDDTKDSNGLTNKSSTKSSDQQNIQIVNPKVFNIPEDNYLKFVSEVTACHISLEGKSRLCLHWHPVGIIEDVWIPKEDLELHRTKLVHFSELPEEFRLHMIELPFVGRQLRNVSASKPLPASSSVQKPSTSSICNSLPTSTTTTKRSHSSMSDTKSANYNNSRSNHLRTSKKLRSF